MGIADFFSSEEGQRRRAWLDTMMQEYFADPMNYYLGPTGIPERLDVVSMLNPVNDVSEAMAAGRDGQYIDMLANTAAVAAPVVAGRIAKAYNPQMVDDAAQWLEDAMMGLSVNPTNAGVRQAAGDFVADESGAMRVWHGSPHDFDKLSMGHIGSGSSDAIDGRGIYLTDDPGEAISYKRPDLRANPFAPPEAQQFSGDGNLYEVGVNADAADFVKTRSKVSDLPQDVQDVVKSRFRANDEFADQRNLSFYLGSDPTLQDEIANLGYKGFSADRYGNTNYVLFDDSLATIFSRNGDNTPQGNAQEVLDYLSTGRASDVTDDMMAGADDMYLFDNYDLPMDEASRMARARDMGFDTGTLRSRFARFDPRLKHLRNLSAAGAGTAIALDQYANITEDDILDMLNAGRGDEITPEMLAQAQRNSQ